MDRREKQKIVDEIQTRLFQLSKQGVDISRALSAVRDINIQIVTEDMSPAGREIFTTAVKMGQLRRDEILGDSHE